MESENEPTLELSIVSTLYCSAPYIEEFYTRMCTAAEKLTSDFELILVNDGSPDNSLDIAIGLHEKDARVRVVDLSRNFGHHKAMMTGFEHARGKRIFLIDCDLEEEPELLETFSNEQRESGADVVYGMQESRRGGTLERYGGDLYYWLVNTLTTDPIPKNLVTIRIMTHRYVQALLEYREREFVMSGVWSSAGFEQKGIVVKKHQRNDVTTYPLRKQIALTVDAISSFSNKPLVYIFYLGMSIVLLSILAGIVLVVRKIFFGIGVPGWPSVMVSVWFLGGISILCIGVVGIYLSKIFTEVKQRPFTIVRRVYDKRTDTQPKNP